MGAEEREGEENIGKSEVVEKQRERRRREGSRASERQSCIAAEADEI